MASQRRALPDGGEAPNDFEVVSETGPIRFSSLFGDKDTLMVYNMMYGPERKAPCPMCTSFLSSWNGDADVPGFSVFTRRNGTVYHFYGGEMSGAMADPGQDPRGAERV